ncbi:MAG: hypothetical protein QOI36_4461 [Pseudonocardiales bacterium]|nr:hypothetical protein [Pseudonocardiales bacterium]
MSRLTRAFRAPTAAVGPATEGPRTRLGSAARGGA